jgi:hypothetical protein
MAAEFCQAIKGAGRSQVLDQQGFSKSKRSDALLLRVARTSPRPEVDERAASCRPGLDKDRSTQDDAGVIVKRRELPFEYV